MLRHGVHVIDCEQSLFCSKILGEERRKLRVHSIRVASDFAASRSLVQLEVSRFASRITCSLSFLRSCPRIFEQNRDCSPCTHGIIRSSPSIPGDKIVQNVTKNLQEAHTTNSTMYMASTLRMRTAISLRQWQPWKAVSSSLGLMSMA